MPTYASSKLPPLRSWEEFEDIVSDIAKLRWRDPNCSRYGRNGQRQNGVDIIGKPSYLDGLSGIQCKNSDEVNIKIINEEITEADNFKPLLNEYIIACTASRDVKLHSAVMQLSQERQRRGKFPVQMWFWEDIALDIARDQELMKKHYPQFTNSSVASEKIEKLIMDSETSDWEYIEGGVYSFKPDVNLAIKASRTDYSESNYYQPWLEKFPDSRGYRCLYQIFYGASLIKQELVVGIDGLRSFIPFPKDGETPNPKLTRWQYKIGKIIHSKEGYSGPLYSFDDYLRRANFSIID